MKKNFGPRDRKIWLGYHAHEVNTNKLLDGKVLTDTGSNEVARTYSYSEWVNIDLERPSTRKTQVRLASGKCCGAGMSANGEYMIYPSRQPGKSFKSQGFCLSTLTGYNMRGLMGLAFPSTASGFFLLMTYFRK